jgi:HlyD family secretion protein
MTLLLFAVPLSACGPGEDAADAYGNFEAIETTISAQTDGELLSFSVREGDVVGEGDIAGQVDTVQLALSRSVLEARRMATTAQIASVISEVEVLLEQRRVAETEEERIKRLFERQAATQKQVDDIEGRISVLDRQIETTRSRIASLESQGNAMAAEIAQIEDRIDRSTIRNPITGTVLTTFVEAHEVVGRGSPLYRLADLSSLDLRAYVSGSELAEISIGDRVEVVFDGPAGQLDRHTGRVTWISSIAEFTPRTVQTREERVNLVYAFKVRVANPDGLLKIGMPGEVHFVRSSVPAEATPETTSQP